MNSLQSHQENCSGRFVGGAHHETGLKTLWLRNSKGFCNHVRALLYLAQVLLQSDVQTPRSSSLLVLLRTVLVTWSPFHSWHFSIMLLWLVITLLLLSSSSSSSSSFFYKFLLFMLLSLLQFIDHHAALLFVLHNALTFSASSSLFSSFYCILSSVCS